MKAHSGSLGWLLYDASCSGLAKRISPRFEPLATSLSAGVPLIIVNEYVVHHRRWVGTCPIWRPDVPRWTSLILWRGLVIKGGIEVEVLNGISLHGGLCQSWPGGVYDTQPVMGAILEHWEQWGLPDYAQFDNDTRFQGPHQHADTIGRIIKMCLSLGVVPVFAPPREHGLQNAIESFNGRWQEKVWARFEHDSLEGLQRQSSCYIEASHVRSAARIEAAPQRQEFPAKWKFDPKKKVNGRLIYIRRTNDRCLERLLISYLSDTPKTDTEVLALVIDSSFRWHGGACTCPQFISHLLETGRRIFRKTLGIIRAYCHNPNIFVSIVSANTSNLLLDVFDKGTMAADEHNKKSLIAAESVQ